MTEMKPVHALQTALEVARMREIREISKAPSQLSNEALRRIVIVQVALTAVREEIAAHEVKVGGGSERPLA